jgi:hypothetical protein
MTIFFQAEKTYIYTLTNSIGQSALEANSFSASQQILNILWNLMFSRSQVAASCLHPEPEESNPHPLLLFKIYFKITMPSMPRS